MKAEGPQLEMLTRRLAECPTDFLLDPRIGSSGLIPVAAVVSDLIRDLSGKTPTAQEMATFQKSGDRKLYNYLSTVLVVCWLLNDPWFRSRSQFAPAALRFLSNELIEIASTTPVRKFTSDPDRREELVRRCLKEIGLRPSGESIVQAQDRLTTLNTIERQQVIRAAREAEARAQKIRQEMAAKRAAAESDAKAMRE